MVIIVSIDIMPVLGYVNLMQVYRITYVKWDRESQRVVQRYTKKKMVSSAANILYRTITSKHSVFTKFEMQSGDEWVPYEIGYERIMSSGVPHAALVERLKDISEFHSAFYRGIP